MNSFRYLLGWLFFFSVPLFASSWTVLVYVEVDPQEKVDALYAWQNINDLARASIRDNVTILVQLHMFGEHAWRYKIEKGVIQQLDHVSLIGSYVEDVQNTFEWAYGGYPADEYGLIWWGHGCGILHPTWDQESDHWSFESDDAFDLCLSCQRRGTIHSSSKRAILLNSQTRRYISNDDMVALLKIATESIIKKKIRILGLDLCLGAAIEHAYQIAPYVDYLIGCQNCELPDGFDYCGIANRFSNFPNECTEIIKGIVEDYGHYYSQHAKKGIYTLSAVDCNVSLKIVPLIDRLSLLLCQAIQARPILRQIIKDMVIVQCPHFCFVPMYTDMQTVVGAFQHDVTNNAEWQKVNGSLRSDMLQILTQLQAHLQNMVIANTTGKNMTSAKGISIYWPLSHIDTSYLATPFARNNNWISFLAAMGCV